MPRSGLTWHRCGDVVPQLADRLPHQRQSADHHEPDQHEDQAIFGIALPTLKLLHRSPMVDRPRRGSMPRLAGIATHGSGRGLLWNPYPAFTNAARDRLELGVHVELREDVLYVGPHRVGRHL